MEKNTSLQVNYTENDKLHKKKNYGKYESICKDTGYSSDADTSDSFEASLSNSFYDTLAPSVHKILKKKRKTRHERSLYFNSEWKRSKENWDTWDYYLPPLCYGIEYKDTTFIPAEINVSNGDEGIYLDSFITNSSEKKEEIMDRIERKLKCTKDSSTCTSSIPLIFQSPSILPLSSSLSITSSSSLSSSSSSFSFSSSSSSSCLFPSRKFSTIYITMAIVFGIFISSFYRHLPLCLPHIEKAYHHPPPL